jgi:hypothetical protein
MTRCLLQENAGANAYPPLLEGCVTGAGSQNYKRKKEKDPNEKRQPTISSTSPHLCWLQVVSNPDSLDSQSYPATRSTAKEGLAQVGPLVLKRRAGKNGPLCKV